MHPFFPSSISSKGTTFTILSALKAPTFSVSPLLFNLGRHIHTHFICEYPRNPPPPPNETKHQENMSMKKIPPQTPISYSKTLGYRDIPIFLIFDPKYILWVDARHFVENVFCQKCCNFKNIQRKILRFIP